MFETYTTTRQKLSSYKLSSLIRNYSLQNESKAPSFVSTQHNGKTMTSNAAGIKRYHMYVLSSVLNTT